VVEVLRSGAFDDDDATLSRKAFRDRFCVLDDGLASERVVRRVFLGEQLWPIPRQRRHSTPTAVSSGW
jgi:CDP-glycerol glycerophosphotransferase